MHPPTMYFQHNTIENTITKPPTDDITQIVKSTSTKLINAGELQKNLDESITAAQQKQTQISDIYQTINSQQDQWQQQLSITNTKLEYQTKLNTEIQQQTLKLEHSKLKLNEALTATEKACKHQQQLAKELANANKTTQTILTTIKQPSQT